MQNALKRDRTARDNNLSRQRKNSKAPYAVDFQLAVGDEVSYDGVLHKIKAVNGPPGEAITSTIQVKGNEKTRKVRMSELRPTATPMPTTFLEREEPNYGDFVFYEGDEEARGGRPYYAAEWHGVAHDRTRQPADAERARDSQPTPTEPRATKVEGSRTRANRRRSMRATERGATQKKHRTRGKQKNGKQDKDATGNGERRKKERASRRTADARESRRRNQRARVA